MVPFIYQLAGLGLLVHVIAEVHEGGKILDNSTLLVMNWTYEHRRPEFRAILAAVQNFNPAFGTAIDFGLDFGE